MWSRNLMNGEALAPWGLLRHWGGGGVKLNFFPFHATKACRVHGGVDPLILNLRITQYIHATEAYRVRGGVDPRILNLRIT